MIGKIAILGGSSVYTPEFISCIIVRNLGIEEIALFGRTEHKLDLVRRFCQRMLYKNGFPTRVTGTTDLKQAVSGASYIINQVRVGGLAARIRDEKIPLCYGMIGDEAVGAGAFTNAMRTLPVVLQYARQIEEVAPNAILIDLTNPMAMVVETLNLYTKLRVVGACDVAVSSIKKIAKLMRIDWRCLNVDYFGLNHFGWIQDVKINGHSQMDRLLDRLGKRKPNGFDIPLIELFRMVPTPHVSFFFHGQTLVRKQLERTKHRGEELLEAEDLILKQYENENLCDIPEVTKDRNAAWYENSIVPLIEALESETENEIILCMRNDGNLRSLPDTAAVELPALVSKRGIRVEKKIGESPCFIKGLFQAIKASERLSIEAVMQKSYHLALQALVIHPLVPSYGAAQRFLDRIIAEEGLELK